MDTDGIFLCEDVSKIEFKNGLFYLTDKSGGVKLQRAMRPATFFRCVAGAVVVAEQFEAELAEVASMRGRD